MNRFFDRAQRELSDLERRGLRRRIPEPAQNGRPVNLGSNDYLALAHHPAVRRAAARAALRDGAGATGSRLLSGSLQLHLELERRLALLKSAENCLLFPTGYAAGSGAIPALAGEGDLILSDRLNHACLIDGCRLSRAAARVYEHVSPASCEELLHDRDRFNVCLIVTDGIFSMDGDVAPLPELLEIAERYDAMLLVDDAHATGVLGPGGSGAASFYGLKSDRLIQMGTLSKALASQGGFIAAAGSVIDLLISRARPAIFSTALAPASAAGALEALQIAQRESWRREKLLASSLRLRLTLGQPEIPSPIIPLLIGTPEAAQQLSRELLQAGFFVPAIRPPAVPAGTSRLRISLTSGITEDQIAQLADLLQSREVVP